jgi:hypothetical protein
MPSVSGVAPDFAGPFAISVTPIATHTADDGQREQKRGREHLCSHFNIKPSAEVYEIRIAAIVLVLIQYTT